MGLETNLRRAMRRFVVVAALAAALRAIIPLGYMIAVDGGGLSVVPCVGMARVQTRSAAPDHHAHAPGHATDGKSHGGHDESLKGSTTCPYSIASVAAIETPHELRGRSAAIAIDFPPANLARLNARTTDGFHARAPPPRF